MSFVEQGRVPWSRRLIGRAIGVGALAAAVGVCYLAYVSFFTEYPKPLPAIDFNAIIAADSQPIDSAADRTRAVDTATSVRAEERPRPRLDTGARREPLRGPPGKTPLVIVRVPWTSTSKVQKVGDIPPLITNGYRVETGKNETVRLQLPDGGTLILPPESRFTFGGDSARVMKGILGGEAVLEVPPRTWWQVLTSGGAFNLGTGRYALRSGTRENGTAISIERGRVYAFGDSVVGTGVFAVVTEESRTVRRAEDGTGFPVLPPESEP